MTILYRSDIHINEKSHDCLIAEIGNIKNGGKKVKMTYEAYNAVEKCTIECFDGYKWNSILSMLDLGEKPETRAYITWGNDKRRKRANDLFKKAETICKLII